MSDAEAIDLSVIIPAFNEGANVSVVAASSVETLERHLGHERWEIVLVNDGSTDQTGQHMDRLAAADARIRVRHHSTNRGFGAGLLTGYRAARGVYVTLISADGEIGVDQALRLRDAIGSADLMISRRVRPAQLSRSLFSAGFAFLTRVITGFDAAEMSGIYVIRRDVLHALPLHSTTGVLNFEIVMRCAARGCEIRSGLTEVRPRLSGQSKVTNVRTMTKAVWELLKLRFPRARRPHA